MIENRAYEGDEIDLYEHPGPACEVFQKSDRISVAIISRRDAEALIESLQRFVKALDEQNSKPGTA